MAGAQPLTRDRVLDAAEDALRRFGPAKTTVVDVARALGVSHGTVYRHVASKAELWDAVLERWLERMSPQLAAIAREEGPAGDRLRRFLETLARLKRDRARDDPDLFAAYGVIAVEARDVVRAHVAELTAYLGGIVADGMASGEFAPGSAAEKARAVLDATAMFHHPSHASQWADPGISDAFERVWGLVAAGLASR